MSPSEWDSVAKVVYGGVATTFLGSLCLWFVTRYIKGEDDFKASIKKQVDEAPGKFAASVKKIEDTQVLMGKQVEEIKQANVDFQGRVQKELVEIERHAIQTEKMMERTAATATALDAKLTQMSEKVVFHDKVLTDLVKVAKGLREQVADNKDQIQTVIRKINEDKIIVGQKTKKPDNKG